MMHAAGRGDHLFAQLPGLPGRDRRRLGERRLRAQRVAKDLPAPSSPTAPAGPRATRSPFAEVRQFRPLASGPKIPVPGAVPIVRLIVPAAARLAALVVDHGRWGAT